MNRKIGDVLIFICSFIALSISYILLRKFGAYEISYGYGTVVIDGGWFLIVSNIIRVIVLFILSVISGIRLFRKKK